MFSFGNVVNFTICCAVVTFCTIKLIKHIKGKEQSYVPQVTVSLTRQIKNLKQLSTLKVYQPHVLNSSNCSSFNFLIKRLNIPGTTREAQISYKVVVTLGCDLSKAKVITLEDRVSLIVPHCKILDGPYIDYKSFEVLKEHSGVFSSIRLKEIDEAIKINLDNIRQTITEERELIASAEDNAKAVLSAIITSTGKKADITFVNEELIDATNRLSRVKQSLPDDEKKDGVFIPVEQENQPVNQNTVNNNLNLISEEKHNLDIALDDEDEKEVMNNNEKKNSDEGLIIPVENNDLIIPVD